MIQDLDPRFVRGHEASEAGLHGFVPNLGFELVGEAVGTADDLLQQSSELRLALLIGAGGAGQEATPHQSKEAQAIIAAAAAASVPSAV